MSPSTKSNRREFMRVSLFAFLAIPFAGLIRSVLAGKSVPVPAGMTEVPATDPVATAIGYKANIKDIDYAKYPQRKKPEAKSQFCKNCALFTSVNDSWGKCQMLTSGVVSSTGWCGSWSKKAS